MPNWQVTNCRFTVFPAPDTPVSWDLWEYVVGVPAESTIVQRNVGIQTDSGPFADGNLRLQIQPVRSDWFYDLPDFALPAKASGLFGGVDPFLSLIRRWCDSSSFREPRRLALGLTLNSKTKDKESGYDELKVFIDGVPDPATSSDFVYQVNRPRESKTNVPNLQINRLSRWSVATTAQVAVNVFGSAPQSIQTDLQLVLDLSTNADFSGTIPSGEASNILDDLLEGAREISSKGNRF